MAHGARGFSVRSIRAGVLVAALVAQPLIPARVVSAQTVASDSAIRAVLKARVDGGWNTGIVVGVIEPGGKRRIVAYGTATPGVPLDAASVFEIGSITKTFTATILADMVRKGEVALDDPVAKYLPAGTRIPERGGKQITLLDLATQSSGLPRMPTNFAPADPANPYVDYGADRMFAFLAGYTLPRDIGAQYEYSNLGVGLLGEALARRAGAPSFEALVMQRVLVPLRMNDSRITLTPSMKQHLAPGHDPALKQVANWDLGVMAGAGAIRSTVPDMLTYLAAYLDSTSVPLGAAARLAREPRRPTSSPVMRIGLAWNVVDANGRKFTWHNGGTGGYRTWAGFDPARGVGVVVLSNTATGVDDIGQHILDTGIPLAPPAKPRPMPTAVTLSADILQSYVGEYQLSPTFAIVISLRDGQLVAQATGQSALEVLAEAKDKLFLKTVDAQLEIQRDASGAVSGLVLVQGGARQQARKIR